MRRKEPLRVAIVGCGAIAQLRHIPSLLEIRDAKVVAICDKNEDLVKQVAQRFNIRAYYTDFVETLDKEELDMVDICTAPQTHLILSMEAMKAGCHVLVEKPMAPSLKEADELINATKENNVKLCQIHNMLFEPVMMRACAMVNSSRIGDIVGVDIQFLHTLSSANIKLMDRQHWSHSLPAGILTEVLPHPIYLAAAFLGKVEPVGIHSGKVSSYDWVVADETRVILKGIKGVGTITYSPSSAKFKMIIDIHGTKKHLRIDLWNSVMTEYGIGAESLPSRALENLSQSFSILTSTLSTTLSVISNTFHSGHYNLMQAFINSIQKDIEPPVTLQEARNVLEVMEKVAAQI
jgi:predicted dehydrogenase